jgi:hypothetical protein
MRKKQKERMNTQNYMEALNEKEPSPWISNLKDLAILVGVKTLKIKCLLRMIFVYAMI